MYIEKSFQRYMANSFWKDYCDNAPEGAKEYIKYDFGSYKTWMGDDKEDEKISREHLHELMKKFNDEDWDYIIKHCGNNMGKASLIKRRKEMQG